MEEVLTESIAELSVSERKEEEGKSENKTCEMNGNISSSSSASNDVCRDVVGFVFMTSRCSVMTSRYVVMTSLCVVITSRCVVMTSRFVFKMGSKS